MATRDLTRAQFLKKIEKHNIKPDFFCFYFNIGNGINVCGLNGGEKRRSQLAYLLEQKRKFGIN